jgi:2-oxo-4-hydroxy-4-carboxy-5-ureidoimidazoline decarboxylase
MDTSSIDLVTLSGLDQSEFVAAMDGVFEHSPWVAERAWFARPFSDCDVLHRALVGALLTATRAEQMDLIRAHPELSRRRRTTEVTRESADEQNRAGLHDYSDAEATQLEILNAAYRRKFDFPFVIAVRGLDSAQILQSGTRRLRNSRDLEIDEALRQISAIARFRLEERWLGRS